MRGLDPRTHIIPATLAEPAQRGRCVR